MDTTWYNELIGLSVHISRSDGRIHLATVKSVDPVKCSVMVEWQEAGNCRGKEIEVSELCSLNPELKSVKTENKNASDLPSAAPDKKYEGRLRSSRIPAPASSFLPTKPSASAVLKPEEPVSLRNQARQTCHFQASAPSAALVPQTRSELPHENSVVNSANSNQRRRKNETKPVTSLAEAREAAKENNEPSQPAKGRRKSMASHEPNKANKRMSCVIKPPEMQLKRGKFGETRPNQKFYDMIQEFRETLEIIPISTSEVVEPHRICVCVRKRPLNKQEMLKKEIDVVSVPGKGALLVHEPKQKVDLTKYLENQVFQFDYSFDETASNDLVYRFTARPLVRSIFEGGMATCFAYGQTGSGKTHTMGGEFAGKQQNSAKGIYAFASQDVFAYLNHSRYSHLDLCVYASFFEIYNGKVYDLLNKKAKLRVLEDERQQVQVVGLDEVYVKSAEDIIKLIQAGSACRTSGQTSANANSSRSHAILQIILRRRSGRTSTLHGKFSLVDLAGNERGTDVSSNDRNTLVETAEINRSLLALKECIRSLGKNSDHIPFRLSTLTKVLRDSFIGEKSRTCMISMVSPGMSSCEYTMNTLRYADRVKELNANPKCNGVAKAEESSDISSEESVDTSVYDAISQVSEHEEKIYVELQKANDLVLAMQKTSYNIETGLEDIMHYCQTLKDTALALKSAVEQERMMRLNH